MTTWAGERPPGCSVHGHRHGGGRDEHGRPVVQAAVMGVPLNPKGAPVLPPVGIAPRRPRDSIGGIPDPAEHGDGGQEGHSQTGCKEHESRDRFPP